MVSTGVPHNIEHLEPATQLRRTQRTSISDRLLHAKRSELEQAAEAAPIQQLDGRPHGNLPAVLLLVVSNEVLSRAAKRFVVAPQPLCVGVTTPSNWPQEGGIQMGTRVDTP